MMVEPDRLRERLDARELSQAELARRVGVTQQSIAKLVAGRSSGSRFLHRIARELQTTTAYLEGETDDPASDIPDDLLTSDEREWIELLRRLLPKDRDAVMQLTRSLAEGANEGPVPTIHDKQHTYRAAG